mgnify:CR=1 FL=1
MLSTIGEKVKLKNTIRLKDELEIWLMELTKEMKNTLAQKPKGFGKYTFQDLNILTKANGMPIGNIILWKYEQKNDLVTIEYSIQKTSKELIMKIPFTKLTKGKKRN